MATVRFSPACQSGLSIVEILITLTLGLFIVGGVLYTFVGSRAVFSSSEALARIQEDGRMAMERLTRETRQAGYMGCASGIGIVPSILVSPAIPAITPVQVFDDGTSWTPLAGIRRVAGTDVLRLERAGMCTTKLAGNMTTDNANIQIDGDNPCGWSAGQVLMIMDCSDVDVFAATNVSVGSGETTIAHAATRNISPKLSKAYGADATVSAYTERTFFVGVHPTLAVPALYEFDGANTTDIVTNVYDFQVVSVSEDADTDGAPDKTVLSTDAIPTLGAVNWSQAVAMQLRLSVRSEADGVAPDSDSYRFDGGTVTDRRLRRDFSTSIGLRNRLP